MPEMIDGIGKALASAAAAAKAIAGLIRSGHTHPQDRELLALQRRNLEASTAMVRSLQTTIEDIADNLRQLNARVTALEKLRSRTRTARRRK
jgi:hypothetical protein